MNVPNTVVQSLLGRLREAFPEVALVQTYGMSELGVLRSRSRDSGSPARTRTCWATPAAPVST